MLLMYNQVIWFMDIIVSSILCIMAMEQLRLSCAPKNLKVAVVAVYPYKIMLLCIAVGSFSWAVSPIYNWPPTLYDLLFHSGTLGLFYVHYYGGIKWRRLRIQSYR